MKLQTRLFLGYLLVFTLMLAIASVSYTGFSVSTESSRWVAHTHHVIGDAHLIEKLVIDMETGQRGFLLTGEDDFLQPYTEGQKQYQSAMKKLQGEVADNPAQVKRLKQIDRLVSKWQAVAAVPEIEARAAMDRNAWSMGKVEKLIAAGTGKSVMDSLRVELREFISVEEALLQRRNHEVEVTARQNSLAVVLGTVIAIGLGIGGMLLTSRNIQIQVGGEPATIAKITERIAQGDLDVETGDGDTNTGILASVATMAVFLKENRDKATVMDWFKTGQNQLNETMSGELSVLELSDNVVRFLAEHLNAQVGAIYVAGGAGGDSSTLYLAGTYAFTKRKGLNDTIEFGAGLVGQAARGKKMISVDRLPDDYTRISSATGDASPRNMVVVPLVYEGVVKGVVELGGLHEFSDDVLEFLEGTADSIAIGINSAQNRIQIQQALETTTEQASKLQLQQERLAAANEELHKKTAVLEEQKKQVESANEELEITRAEIQAKADDLTQASRYKSEFLANMSHELRTPLNSLLILASSLSKNKTGNMTPEQVEKSSVIHSAGADLLRLINDILDLSKVESGKLEIQLSDVPVQAIVDHLRQNFEPVSQDKGVVLILEVDSSVPESLVTDEVRVEQILRNLLSNAFKFTGAGSVTMRVAEAPENRIAFAVTDTGIGIASDKQRGIFEAFQQADGSIGREYGGTGLGLSISRNLAGLLGGSIDLESREGEGSTFTLWLPVAANPSESRGTRRCATPTPSSIAERSEAKAHEEQQSLRVSSELAHALEGVKILVVDDDMRNTFALGAGFEEMGAAVAIAGNGQLALDTLEREDGFDVVIMDIMMPVMNGFESMIEIRASERYGDVLIVALTAMASDEDGENCMAAGANLYLTKPVDLDELVARIRGALEQNRDSVEPA